MIYTGSIKLLESSRAADRLVDSLSRTLLHIYIDHSWYGWSHVTRSGNFFIRSIYSLIQKVLQRAKRVWHLTCAVARHIKVTIWNSKLRNVRCPSYEIKWPTHLWLQAHTVISVWQEDSCYRSFCMVLLIIWRDTFWNMQDWSPGNCVFFFMSE
jgi:hypothetical protein